MKVPVARKKTEETEEPEEPSKIGREQPPPGISDKELECWILLRERLEKIIANRSNPTSKHSGGRKGADIINAENVLVKARIALPKSYPIAPALKKLLKTIAEDRDTAGATDKDA